MLSPLAQVCNLLTCGLNGAPHGQDAARIEPLGRTIAVEDHQTLLEAALAQGLWLRSGCRIGNCRECLARVVEGRVRYRIEWPKLSPEDQAAGFTLPCVAQAETNVVLLQPWAALKG